MIAVIGFVASGLVFTFFVSRWIPSAIGAVVMGFVIPTVAISAAFYYVYVPMRAGDAQGQPMISLMAIIVLTAIGAVIGRVFFEFHTRSLARKASAGAHTCA